MPALTLPASLNRQFDLLERRLWRMDALVAVTGALGSLLVSYTLEFASDRMWDTPHFLRVIFALGGWAGFLFFARRYGANWVWGRRSVRSLAVIVQKRYRRLGDRLLGIVELADPNARPSDYSPELCHAAIAQVAGEASSFDFQQAAGERRPRRYLFAFLVMGFAVAILAIVAPEAGWNALLRWFHPTENIDRYTFVSIEALPDHLVVAQGEPFEIDVGLASDSRWRPGVAESWFADGPSAVLAPVKDGVAAFHLPGQTQPRVLWLALGDVTRSVRIIPTVRPDLSQLRVRLDLPVYLQYPTLDQRIDSGSLDFLPGTRATFTGQAVRDLASATLDGQAPLDVQGAHFTTRPLLLELERDLTFTWRDTLGLAGPGPETIHVTPREDQPPEVEVRGLEAAIAILPEEIVPIDLDSTDDYGVQRITLAWQRAAPTPMDPPGPLHEIKIADGAPQARSLGGHYDFSPALLQIEPDTTILIRGMAVDYYPNRQPASSPIYRIHVLSREAHARLVHDQFEKLMEQFEELTRRQEAILQSGQATRAQSPKDLAGDDSAQSLNQQSGDQKETASQLSSLADQVEKMLAEALRNPEITQDVIKQWAEHAAQMRQIAASGMQPAAQSLSSAADSAPQRPQQLDQALGQEQQVLDAMHQLERQSSQDLDTLMAQTLAARLRRAASSEREIADDFQKTLPDTIGLTTDQLPDERRQDLESMSAIHGEVTREAARLQEEITRLFERTALDRYGDVSREMDGLRTNDSMTALGKLVEQNIGVESIGSARYWSDQFERWAARLGSSDQSKSGPTKPGGQPNTSQMEALLALMRLRQQQDQLRDQTTVLQEQKNTSDDYSDGAKNAAQQQAAMRDQVRSFEQDGSFPIPPAQLAPVDKSMNDAAQLLAKPETGKPTYDAQTDAINLLDAAISQQAGKMGESGNSMANMMGLGGNGSGNTGGGTTNKPNVPIVGSVEGEAPDQRTVIQAGGLDNSQLPGEFRDAIESYHRAIEQSQ
jgi:hypothetical protein